MEILVLNVGAFSKSHQKREKLVSKLLELSTEYDIVAFQEFPAANKYGKFFCEQMVQNFDIFPKPVYSQTNKLIKLDYGLGQKQDYVECSQNAKCNISVIFVKKTNKKTHTVSAVYRFPNDTAFMQFIGLCVGGMNYLNVHVPIPNNVSYGSENLNAIINSLHTLEAYIREQSSCIVMGDFNNGKYNTDNYIWDYADKAQETYKIVKQSDAYLRLFDEGNVTDLLCQNGVETTTFYKGTCIDHVLIKGLDANAFTFEIGGFEFSDHKPIFIQWNNESKTTE